jgi:hypothetical protein
MSYGCYGINFCVYKNVQMTTAKELMIGNLFLFTDEPKEIRRITGSHIEYAERYNGWFNSFFEPIPITEEWLELKLGFEKIKFFWANRLFIIKKDQFGKYTFCIGDQYTVEIEYIHQLQNLYLCICGKELQLK